MKTNNGFDLDALVSDDSKFDWSRQTPCFKSWGHSVCNGYGCACYCHTEKLCPESNKLLANARVVMDSADRWGTCQMCGNTMVNVFQDLTGEHGGRYVGRHQRGDTIGA